MLKRSVFIWIILLGLIPNAFLWAQSDTTQTDTTQTEDSAAASPNKTTKTFENWVVNCAQITPEGGTPKTVCEMSQTLTQKQSGRRILSIKVAKSNKENQNGLDIVFITPFGLNLSKGATLKADDQVVLERGFLTCLPNGCIVRTVLTEELQNSLIAAENAAVTFYDLSEKNVDISFSLNGFNDALADMKTK